jgi:hypothetical protein
MKSVNRPTIRQAWYAIVILVVSTSCALGQPKSGDANGPVAPGKFVPTFAIVYGRPKNVQALTEFARFDLIDAGRRIAADGSCWPALKQLNPHLKVFIYQMGPGEFDNWSWTSLNPGQDWNWITANHGLTSADRWTAIGARGDYLQNNDARLMVIGNPAWQKAWIDAVNHYWSPTSPNYGADGIFCDNTDYEWPSEGRWYRQGHPEEADVPADYYHNGVYDPEPWKAQAKAFLDRAVTELADQHRLLIPNFGYMSKDPQSWHDLDSQPHPVFAAMEEGAFATPWGAPGQFTFYDEQHWLNQVNAMRNLKHIRALMLVHGLPDSSKPGLSRMDVADAGGNCGWDVFWFGLTSFLQGYDDVRQNAYLGFTVWGYGSAPWFDEFDPAHLNLGRAQGESHRVDGTVGHCYVREFERGWAVVNPTDTPAKGLPVPQGEARVLDHGTFEHPDAQPLVDHFDLAAHRGIVLLRAK